MIGYLQPEDVLQERIWLLATDEIALIPEEDRLSSTNLPFAFSSISLRNTFEGICDFGDSPLRCLGQCERKPHRSHTQKAV